jgi:hypothetical protein
MFDLLVPSPDPFDDKDRSAYERVRIPHAFKPRLSLFEAAIAVFGALIRILLGSLLFAVWGTWSLKIWTSVPQISLRVIILLPMLVLFLVVFALVMIAISAVARFAAYKRI